MLANPEVSVDLGSLDKKPTGFSIGFWIIAEKFASLKPLLITVLQRTKCKLMHSEWECFSDFSMLHRTKCKPMQIKTSWS